MQAFFASIPYLDFGEKEFDDIAKYEAYYEVLTYVVFSIFNYRTYTQVKVARGRTLCDGTEDARHGARGSRPNQLEGLCDSLPSRGQARRQDWPRLLKGNQDRFRLDYRAVISP